jgi:uncharacterized protein YukE
MDQVGASLSQLEALGSEFRRQRGTAESLRSSVSGRLGDTHWIGGAADAFRNRWSQDYEPMLKRLEEELAQLGTYVDQKRSQLEEAGNR